MNLIPYLFFKDQCEAAMNHYADVLGAKVEMLIRASSGPGGDSLDEVAGNRVMFAQLRVGDQLLMASDQCGPNPGNYERPASFRVNVDVTTVAEAEQIYAHLAEGGNADMPLQQTFFAARFGTVTDRFGIPWMVNCRGDV